MEKLSKQLSSCRNRLANTQKYMIKMEESNQNLRQALQETMKQSQIMTDDDTVDRRLVNKLLTTFLSVDADKRQEVLKLLMNILKFSKKEKATVLAYQNQSSLGFVGGLVGGLFSAAATVEPMVGTPDTPTQNLSEMWV